MIRKKLHTNTPLLVVLVLLILLYVHYMTSLKCVSGELAAKNKPKYRLIVLILTAVDNLERRDAIRKTWLCDDHYNVKHLFAIGTLDIQPEQRDTLLSEKQKYNDLLLLSKLQDSYNTITKKILYSMGQIYETYEFDFLLKCDDDSVVLVDRVLKELDKWQSRGIRKELYWGFFNGKAQVKRSGPWKETDWILCDYYLPYALGGGYVLSSNLVKFIARNSDVLKIQNSEDVSVGLWLAPVANIERKHDVRFDTEYRSRGCFNDYIITHKQSVESMKNIHDLRKATGALCTKEVRNRMSYQYDWTVPPSQCCNRQSGIP
ncbi:beta-1,3-galactosyltransferase 6 isoform X1 [Orussus abietinus]|uniref:beta-1,3-galactosyltransferase 6 isoform X1 n=2 Tax=Orussus abietinus TaxID=222816 RepID=UPI00062516DF|nr:beta-1,3-galactosyltransferase 6 isoform X1 [Orussus abietinus]XP_012281014.1 beta-1,3-galactosyltransferase 6 isoform X1 [Orussus abietinus]